jgi:hypothetical protein
LTLDEFLGLPLRAPIYEQSRNSTRDPSPAKYRKTAALRLRPIPENAVLETASFEDLRFQEALTRSTSGKAPSQMAPTAMNQGLVKSF